MINLILVEIVGFIFAVWIGKGILRIIETEEFQKEWEEADDDKRVGALFGVMPFIVCYKLYEKGRKFIRQR